MRPPPLIVRVDGGPAIGLGHMMRCLALAQQWRRDGGEVTFVTACSDPRVTSRLREAGCIVEQLPASHPDAADWLRTSATLAQQPGAPVVLDGYHFGLEYEARIRHAGHPLLVIDDGCERDAYAADMVLNQNASAGTLNYPRTAGLRLLLGPEYALLRVEFAPFAGMSRDIPPTASKLLVTLGGTDRANHTRRVLWALERVREPLDITMVIGAANPHVQALERELRSCRQHVTLYRDPPNMPALMAWADVAISAAGSTALELMFMGLPSLLMVASENQRTPAAALDRAGAAVNLGWHGDLDPQAIADAFARIAGDADARRAMSAAARILVDGRGCARVNDALAAMALAAVELPR
jgi:UDP-2,4-diacetamido-2,4,6-trideoxy-beta-L-altropyranose hydrolase